MTKEQLAAFADRVGPVEMVVEAGAVRIRCGSLEVDFADAMTGGPVRINGQKVSCQALTFSFDLGGKDREWPPRVTMRIFPDNPLGKEAAADGGADGGCLNREFRASRPAL